MTKTTTYEEFLSAKSQRGAGSGFKPIWMPDFLFDFQAAATTWNIEQGRSATFADCGMGKTPMEHVWAENVVRKTNKPVLELTPLGVGSEVYEAVRNGRRGIGIELKPSYYRQAVNNVAKAVTDAAEEVEQLAFGVLEETEMQESTLE